MQGFCVKEIKKSLHEEMQNNTTVQDSLWWNRGMIWLLA